MRIAVWTIGTAYLVLTIAIAVFWYLVQSKRMDIGSTMASVLLLGATGLVVTLALLGGSVMGLTALARDPASRRIGPILAIVAGLVGTIVLAWISWGFWMH